ncbi:Uncharacterised protein [Mycobacteroides abscessus subsp. massiliense]|nr:Uncharacterised protein [Mycobacteroides abscessus subsp. massiliense]
MHCKDFDNDGVTAEDKCEARHAFEIIKKPPLLMEGVTDL